MSADNQQERLDAKWIVGFVDGEGCFHIGINEIKKMSLGWQVLPEFRVVQHQRDEQVLYKFQEYFGFGKIKVNREDQYGVRKEFRVRGLENLNQLVKFFQEHPFQTATKRRRSKVSRILRDYTPDTYRTKVGEDIVRPSWRHEEATGNSSPPL